MSLAGKLQQAEAAGVESECECCQDPEMETRYWVRIVSVAVLAF